MHRGEHGVRPRLQREVQVGAHGGRLGHRRDHVVGDLGPVHQGGELRRQRALAPTDRRALGGLLLQREDLLPRLEGEVAQVAGALRHPRVQRHDRIAADLGGVDSAGEVRAVIERQEPGVRVHTHGVPDRIIYAAPRARQLAMLGLDAEGIARRVRALHETEALAG